MPTVKRVAVAVVGLMGLALVVRGAWGGVWPLSVQLILGILLLAYAILRLTYSSRGRTAPVERTPEARDAPSSRRATSSHRSPKRRS
jgi:hypothetical protein